MEDPVLETDRLRLRPPTADDHELAEALVGDPVVMAFLGGAAVPRADVPAIVERWIARWTANGIGPFLLERATDGAFVGRGGLLVFDTRSWTVSTLAAAGAHAQVELGWSLVRSHWGNGYATEAAAAIREWAYAERGIDSLVSVITPDNLASQAVARRLGCVPGETVELADDGPAVLWQHPGPGER